MRRSIQPHCDGTSSARNFRCQPSAGGPMSGYGVEPTPVTRDKKVWLAPGAVGGIFTFGGFRPPQPTLPNTDLRCLKPPSRGRLFFVGAQRNLDHPSDLADQFDLVALTCRVNDDRLNQPADDSQRLGARLIIVKGDLKRVDFCRYRPARLGCRRTGVGAGPSSNRAAWARSASRLSKRVARLGGRMLSAMADTKPSICRSTISIQQELLIAWP